MFETDFDRQKLMYHPAKVADWLEHGVTRGPLYTEMELCSRCNCRCLFCGVDHLVNQSDDTIAVSDAKRIIDQLADLGNRAVMFCGHGEPLLHPDAGEIIAHVAGRMGASVTTNGILLDERGVELIDGLEWIRFSINAGNADAYASVHRTRPATFDRVLSNIAAAVGRKQSLDLGVTVGSQLVLIDDNADSAVELARRMKEIGVDYFSVKPYSQHPMSKTRLDIDYSRFDGLERELAALADDSFRVIYRSGSMARLGAPKPYAKCYGTHFLCFVSANGDVWECNTFVGNPRFRIGNATEESMADIWTGPRRREVLDFIHNEMDITDCRDVCRMDACNRYLWRLKHPWPHDDFI